MSATSFHDPPQTRTRRLVRVLTVLVAGSALSGCYTAANAPYSPIPPEASYPERLPQATSDRDPRRQAGDGSVHRQGPRAPSTPRSAPMSRPSPMCGRGESTGGIIISVPYGTPNGRASSERRARSPLDAGGDRHSGQPDRDTLLSARRPGQAVGAPAQLFQDGRGSRPVRACGPAISARPTTPAYNENRQYWNLGCANQRNLAAMVANPADLVQPRGETPSSTQRRTVVLDKYRKGESAETHLSECRPRQAERRRQMMRTALTRRAMAEAAPELPARDEHIAPAPRISIQAFCESVETAAAVQAAGEDRRLGKAHLKIQMGGMAAATEAYRSAPTPNVIMLEFERDRPRLSWRASIRWPRSATPARA